MSKVDKSTNAGTDPVLANLLAEDVDLALEDLKRTTRNTDAVPSLVLY